MNFNAVLFYPGVISANVFKNLNRFILKS